MAPERITTLQPAGLRRVAPVADYAKARRIRFNELARRPMRCCAIENWECHHMKPLIYVAMTAGLLAACGETTSDRAEGGAAVGAASGAAIGAVFGGVGAIPGALIGAAVGAGTGAETSPQQVNLGEPIWDKDHPAPVGQAPVAQAEPQPQAQPLHVAMAGDDVRNAQRQLRAQGYYHGRIDGLYGPQTRRAVIAYQRHNDLQRTATLDADTMARLSGGTNTSYGSAGTVAPMAGGR